MSNPSVSILVPICNVERYLRECLDSLVNQTLKDIEIICLDDGSTDASLAVVEESLAAIRASWFSPSPIAATETR